MREAPRPVRRHERFDVVVRIGTFIARRTIANFQNDRIDVGSIGEMMRVASRGKEGRGALDDVDKFILRECRWWRAETPPGLIRVRFTPNS